MRGLEVSIWKGMCGVCERVCLCEHASQLFEHDKEGKRERSYHHTHLNTRAVQQAVVEAAAPPEVFQYALPTPTGVFACVPLIVFPSQLVHALHTGKMHHRSLTSQWVKGTSSLCQPKMSSI